MEPMVERRRAFLAGEGTLTVQEVNDWAFELVPYRGRPHLPVEIAPPEELMVSLVEPGPRDTRGLSGATIL